MQLTTFGLGFVPLALAVTIFARAWLPALVVFSAVFQASSVLDVPVGTGAFGISPYNATAFLAFLVLVWRTYSLRALPSPPEPLRQPASWLLAFAAIAITSAFVMPFLHAGTPVFLLLNKFGFDRGTTPLSFTLSNVVQAANLAVHVCVLAFLFQARSVSGNVSRRMLYGLGAAVVLMLTIGFYERAASLGVWQSFNAFWMNNPGYAQLHSHAISGFRRIVAPFSEASYATTFLAAVWAGLLAVCLFGRCRPWQLFALVPVGIGLINPLGSTGWVAAGAMAAVLLLTATTLSIITGASLDGKALRRRVVLAWLATSIACLVAVWAWTASPAGPSLKKVVDTVLLDKLDSGSARVRHRSNEQALQIVKDTWGMGAGLGSNRASSYMASLVSNTGILGLLCFVAALGSLTWRYFATRQTLGDSQLFAVTALWTSTLAVALAIPDLNLPAYWIFIFMAFLGHSGGRGVRVAASPTRAPRA